MSSLLRPALEHRGIAGCLAVGSLVCILVLTLAPLSNEPGTLHVDPVGAARAVVANDGFTGLILDLAENVGLFVPLGLFVPRALPALDTIGRVTLFALTLSALIEIGQYVLPGGRDADTLDILTNTAGAVCGMLLLRYLERRQTA